MPSKLETTEEQILAIEDEYHTRIVNAHKYFGLDYVIDLYYERTDRIAQLLRESRVLR